MDSQSKSTIYQKLDQLSGILVEADAPVDSVNKVIDEIKKMIVQVCMEVEDQGRLNEIKHKYEFIANNAREFMSLINRNYQYEAANDSYCFAHNKNRNEVIGQSLAELWGQEVFNETIKKYIDDCFAGNEIQYEAWFSFAALGRRCFDVRYYPYYGKDTSVTHVVVITHDITQRKNAEINLKKHQDHLEEMVRDRTQELEDSNQKLQSEILERKRLEERQSTLINDLKDALANVKRLEGLIPICANCKKIRDDKGYWEEVDSYIRDHADVEFTHGICPECMEALYPEFINKHKNKIQKPKKS